MLKLKLQYFGHLMRRPAHWKRPWCWERLKVGEGDDRGWDGWMALPSQWTWVWVNSRSWWWTGRHGVLQFMGSQTVEHDWATELSWTFTHKEPFCTCAVSPLSQERGEWRSFNPFNEHSGLICFRMDWLDLLAVQGTLKISTTTVKNQFFGAQLSLYSNSHIHTWLLKKP